MTDPRDELARLTALCERATAGPWSVHDCGEVIARGEDWLVADVCQWWADTRLVDGYFIAESRSALPAALACLTELLDAHPIGYYNEPRTGTLLGLQHR